MAAVKELAKETVLLQTRSKNGTNLDEFWNSWGLSGNHIRRY